jgi:hypothetical protein
VPDEVLDLVLLHQELNALVEFVATSRERPMTLSQSN